MISDANFYGGAQYRETAVGGTIDLRHGRCVTAKTTQVFKTFTVRYAAGTKGAIIGWVANIGSHAFTVKVGTFSRQLTANKCVLIAADTVGRISIVRSLLS